MGKKKKICGIIKQNGAICQREAVVKTEVRGLICAQHYRTYRARGIVEKIELGCKVPGCNRLHKGRGYCARHSDHIRRYGKILKRTIKDPNEIIEKGKIAEVVLRDMKCDETGRAIIDADMIDIVAQYKWCLEKGYVATRKMRLLYLHHLIIGKPEEGMFADHIDRDGLNNRRKNLRIVTRSQNSMNQKIRSDNTSGVTGVCWRKQDQRWWAQIHINGHTISLGLFKDKKAAIEARREGEVKHFGEYASRVGQLN